MENVEKAEYKIGKFDYDNPPLVGEEIFWNRNDHRWGKSANRHKRKPHILDMNNDSYVCCFTGPRGGGKTSYMTYLTEKCAYLYDKRIVSNYPISLNIRYNNGWIKHIRSEPLDLGKVLTFDEYYRDCILVLDEAPQIINRLATMTWKNRLLDLFIQQIRKWEISLLYASQNEHWVDNELRWQTDIVFYCRDASRRYPKAGYKRGGQILINMKDKSGLYSGYSYDERPHIKRFRLLSELIWNTFDTHQRFDVFEGLRKVSVDLSPQKITDGQHTEDYSYIEKARDAVFSAIEVGKVKSKDFYKSIGDLTKKEKDGLAKRLSNCGVKPINHDKVYQFNQFDVERFFTT